VRWIARLVGSADANGADHLIAQLDRESARPKRSCAQGAEAAGGDAAEVGDDAGRRAAPEHDGPFPIISMDVPRNSVSISKAQNVRGSARHGKRKLRTRGGAKVNDLSVRSGLALRV
jgi:hypothetical protein